MASTADATTTGPPRPRDSRLGAAWDAVGRPDVRVVSTDVFDTLLWRQVREPVDAFPLVGARLLARGWLDPEVSPEAFGRLRGLAETEARRRLESATSQVEVRLDEIYALLPGWLFRGSVAPSEALHAELELERDLLVPDLDVVALLQHAAALGKTVVAISDTYFSADQLRFLLSQPVVGDLELDRIFTSSEHRTNKSGGLFGIAHAALEVAPSRTVHLGDNDEADVRIPDALGVATFHFERRPETLDALMDAEQRYLRTAALDLRSAGGRAAGEVMAELTAIRGKVATREERELVPRALKPFWDFGALVYGPVLAGFADWIGERAADMGAGRVHCFMREGAFLSELVERGAGPRRVEAGPLWLNREVLAKATIVSGLPDELLPLLVRRRRPSVSRFLASVGLTIADVPRFASHGDTSLDDPVVRRNLLWAIHDDPAARAKVLDTARAARERVVAYVRGLLEAGENRLVVADLGWGASAQGLLQRVLDEAALDVDVVGLYLVTHEGAAARLLEGRRVYGFLGELGEPGDAVRLIVRSPEVLEQVFMPEHGSQVDLDDELRPVLAPTAGERDRVQDVEAQAVRDGIAAFQREWSRYRLVLRDSLASLSSARDALRAILVRSVVAPTAEEATSFGRWHHDENQGSGRSELIADPALAERFRHLDPQELRDLPMEELYWPFALASRIDPAWREQIAAAAAGQFDWDAFAAETDTGAFTVEVERGVDVPGDCRLRQVPRRNRFGLSFLRGALRAPAIQEIVLRPSELPAVVRIDFLELRCHAEGIAEPVVLRFEAPADFAQLRRANCFAVNPNVFVVHGFKPGLHLDLDARIPSTVFRVDVACGFATLAVGELVPMAGRIRSVEDAGVLVERYEQTLGDMRSSLSWRVTKPLRVAKKLAGS